MNSFTMTSRLTSNMCQSFNQSQQQLYRYFPPILIATSSQNNAAEEDRDLSRSDVRPMIKRL